MNKETEFEEELSIWNFNSILNYIKQNFIQILLLFLVFVIIYIVDHLSNINATIFSMPSVIAGLPSIKPTIVKRRNSKK